MEDEAKAKWEGKACAKLKGPTAEKVWSLLEDFSSIHKWLPGLKTCRLEEGVSGQVGCVRYCSNWEEPEKWVKEKLVTMDPIERCFSYEVIDNNMGFNSYVATIKVMEAADGDDHKPAGCMIEWSFLADPVEGKVGRQGLGQANKANRPLLEDFCSIHKWLPMVDTCRQVEGVSGQPGCVRYCISTIPSSNSSDEETTKWAKEKLLTMDPIKRCFSYKVIDSNMRFNSYVATIKLLAADGDDNRGYMIEWSFVVDSIEG
ncbi:hypothetical protein HHK36_014191 [Tetracentron sinense]|uniref:Lachrymatory factor synthase n=1 Tax=Tetracentron sinense TaxID=13715 RepID=A0A835DEY6_TETSI|nr:hypothetical protein HHK36_014191 [Tetracentron sinense]